MLVIDFNLKRKILKENLLASEADGIKTELAKSPTGSLSYPQSLGKRINAYTNFIMTNSDALFDPYIKSRYHSSNSRGIVLLSTICRITLLTKEGEEVSDQLPLPWYRTVNVRC